MAFVAGTELFTTNGWKKIENIAGRDKILVRNFLGEAEFIQPMALRKAHYDGKVYRFGSSQWSITITPNHYIVYDYGKNKNDIKIKKVTATEMEANQNLHMHRTFRYNISDTPAKQQIKLKSGTQKSITVQWGDWYRLVAYTIARGFIDCRKNRYTIRFLIDRTNEDYEINLLGDILNSLNIGWSLQRPAEKRPFILVSTKNNLAHRLAIYLGSHQRRKMYIPNSMIYTSSRHQIIIFMEALKDAYRKPNHKYGKKTTFATSNTELIHSLELIATLGGYEVRSWLYYPSGREYRGTKTKLDIHVVTINDPMRTVSPRYKKALDYSGYVYAIDLFDGQVYARGDKYPVWMQPR